MHVVKHGCELAMGIVNCAQMRVSLNITPAKLARGLHAESLELAPAPPKCPHSLPEGRRFVVMPPDGEPQADPRLPRVRSGTSGPTWHGPLRTLARPACSLASASHSRPAREFSPAEMSSGRKPQGWARTPAALTTPPLEDQHSSQRWLPSE